MQGEPDTDRPAATPGFDALGLAAKLLSTIRVASLATLDKAGYPLATLTTLALDHDFMPLILISELSAHTQNLMSQPRFSLLLAETGKGDPLAYPRLTLTGDAARTLSPEAKIRFVDQVPKARLYADFGDFSLWRLEPRLLHLNGGFGKAFQSPAKELFDFMLNL